MLRIIITSVLLFASNYCFSQASFQHPEIGISTTIGISMLTIEEGMVQKTDGFQLAYGAGVDFSHRIGKNFGISVGFGQHFFQFGYSSDQHFNSLNEILDSPFSLKEEERNLYLKNVGYKNLYWVIPFAFDFHLPAHKYANPVSSFRLGFKFFKLRQTEIEATYENIDEGPSILHAGFHSEIQKYLQAMTPTLSTALTAAYQVKWRFGKHWNAKLGFELNHFLEKMNQGLMGSQFGVGVTGQLSYAF